MLPGVPPRTTDAPQPDHVRGPDAVHGYVKRICFKTGPPRLVGAELELIVVDPSRPGAVVPIPRIHDALRSAGDLPGGSVVSFEPGGQLELSSPAIDGLSACWRAVSADVDHTLTALDTAGLSIVPSAVDPYRAPKRQLSLPRYDAMEAYFDSRGRTGRIMMCSTAAIHINLDSGADADDVARRWWILHTLRPVLIGAFANSPVLAERRTGWKSTRQAVWLAVDPPRTRVPTGDDPVDAWAQYALAAPVMLMRANHGDADHDGTTAETRWTPNPGITFAQWLDGAQHRLGPPKHDDLAYHLTTLFPPVRPRGWLEVRYIDAQPIEFWPVPLAVVTALTEHPELGDHAARRVERSGCTSSAGAQHGLDDPRLARAARECFGLAVRAMRDLGTDHCLVDVVESFIDRYVTKSTCPADEFLRLERP